VWDLAIVGAGPAGAAAALGALSARPDLRVLLLDRADFPRDKACGDGIAPHVLDVLAGVGVTGLLDDCVPVRELELVHGAEGVRRPMRRAAYVVPREVFDARLVQAAVRAGATLRRHRVRDVHAGQRSVVLDADIEARVVIGADGAYSLLRRTAGLAASRRQALAIRGYAPTSAERRGRQVIAFGRSRQPSYAWSFDRGDGMANVGYGELLTTRRTSATRELMLEQLEDLLPGSAAGGTAWRGHHLPLSSWRWQQPDGPILLAGDAAGLINPLTGEGLYYAVTTGVLAGRAAADVCATRGSLAEAGARHRAAVRSLLAAHLRHTAALSRLAAVPPVTGAGVRAAAADQGVFDDLVEIGVGRGRVTSRLARGCLGRALPRTTDPALRHPHRSL